MEEDDDLSLSRFVHENQPEANSTINVVDGEEAGPSGTQRDNTGPVTQAHMSSAVSAAMAKSMAEMNTKMNQAMEAYGRGHSDVASCLTKVAQILEDTKKGTKRSSKEEDETDDVVMVEKTIDIRDDGHETIDHEVKLLIIPIETKSLIYNNCRRDHCSKRTPMGHLGSGGRRGGSQEFQSRCWGSSSTWSI